MAKQGNIRISSENMMPIIKKWLYSDKDIFLREIVANGIDAITKYKKLTFGWRDLVGALIFAALIAGVVLFNIYGAQIWPEIYEYIVIT